jgi:hypothetical protein
MWYLAGYKATVTEFTTLATGSYPEPYYSSLQSTVVFLLGSISQLQNGFDNKSQSRLGLKWK